MEGIPRTDAAALFDRYDTFWIDAYGVLVETTGALPGAGEFIRTLRDRDKKLLLVSNDASRQVHTIVHRMVRFGIDLGPEEVLTSGDLIAGHFEREGLVGAPTIVLGTDDSRAYVEAAGGRVVDPADTSAEVVVAADDDGFDFLKGVEATLTTLIRRQDRGDSTHLVLPNPDLIYPSGGGAYGLTSGSVALLLEHGLRVRFGNDAPTFLPLGKPNVPIFQEAARRTGAGHLDRVVMLGDQLGTDILGANAFGVDSVLVGTGLTGADMAPPPDRRPTWYLPGLR